MRSSREKGKHAFFGQNNCVLRVLHFCDCKVTWLRGKSDGGETALSAEECVIAAVAAVWRPRLARCGAESCRDAARARASLHLERTQSRCCSLQGTGRRERTGWGLLGRGCEAWREGESTAGGRGRGALAGLDGCDGRQLARGRTARRWRGGSKHGLPGQMSGRETPGVAAPGSHAERLEPSQQPDRGTSVGSSASALTAAAGTEAVTTQYRKMSVSDGMPPAGQAALSDSALPELMPESHSAAACNNPEMSTQLGARVQSCHPALAPPCSHTGAVHR